jgi:flavodoxin family protein|uniref:flavodoxin family protein n=1 Tax=Roseburia sp. TaxID=2049040 RepID=UPI003FED8C8A
MKILVTYSSKTGNTKKLAEGIYEGLGEMEKEILPMSEVKSLDAYDTVLAGYWVDKGGANEEAAAFLKEISGKKVGVFATLAFWPDSDHGVGAIKAGEDLVKEKNHVIGRYICQGKIDPRMIEIFEKMPKDNPHYPTPEKRKRHRISANHPSAADIACAAELFRERIEEDV